MLNEWYDNANTDRKSVKPPNLPQTEKITQISSENGLHDTPSETDEGNNVKEKRKRTRTRKTRTKIQTKQTKVQQQEKEKNKEKDKEIFRNQGDVDANDKKSVLINKAHTSLNQSSNEHRSFPGINTTSHTSQNNSDPSYLNDGGISHPRIHIHDPYSIENPYFFLVSDKNVYVNNVRNNWMFNGIQNVTAQFHHFGCDINDEQPIKLIPNRERTGSRHGKMMIFFQHKPQALQFIECVNAIQGKLDLHQKKVLLTAQFALRNNMVDQRNYTKSVTGVYCDINQNCNAIELKFNRAIESCGKGKFTARCSHNKRRFNCKVGSKELRDKAVTCLIKRKDLCTAVGTW